MIDAAIRDQAALWMARTRDPRFGDWDALTEWLEADPAHNVAYEEAFAAHDLAGVLDAAPAAAPVTERSVSRWRRPGMIGGGLAGTAAAAALIFALVVPSAPLAEVAIATAPGEHRLIRLQDGTRIALNGGSRLVLDKSNGRTARLEQGEAMFSVVHDETRPFTVDAGGARMLDLGTRFDVMRTARGSEVAVAEGAVLYDPNGAAVRLGAGKMLRRSDASQLVEVSQIDPASVGAWRTGHFVYRDTPLWRVAEDMARATGRAVKVDPAVANRAFTGAIVVPADRAAFPDHLGAILDVTVAQQGNGLYLKARAPR
jgi:transmembrane sensor